MTYEISASKWESGLKVRRYAPKKFKKRIYGFQHRPFHIDEVFIRELYFEETPIETQIIALNRGIWQTFTFAWDETGSDAALVREPVTRQLPNGNTWVHRSPAQCQECHNTRHGWLLGYRFSQLDRAVKGHRKGMNQLDAWVEKGLIKAIPGDLRTNPFPDPTDASVGSTQRARAYLDAYCSYCHQQGGMAHHVGIDLRRTSSPERMGLCRARGEEFVINPQEPHRSLILKRMRDSALPMPPDRLAVDRTGLRWVEDWMRSLSNCPR